MKQLKLKNYEIIGILNRLNDQESLINSTSAEKKLPVAILWKINGNLKKLREVAERIAEEEKKINDEFFNDEKSEKADDQYRIKPEYVDEFIAKKNELMDIENEVDISVINISDLSAFSLVPADFNAIEFMLTDEEEA